MDQDRIAIRQKLVGYFPAPFGYITKRQTRFEGCNIGFDLLIGGGIQTALLITGLLTT